MGVGTGDNGDLLLTCSGGRGVTVRQIYYIRPPIDGAKIINSPRRLCLAKRSAEIHLMSGGVAAAENPTHEVHRGDVPYQAPFTRSTSPNDSLTTTYGADETSLSDAELSEDAFSNKVLAGLHIYEKREEEERAEARPLIMPRARRGATTTANAPTEEKGGMINAPYVMMTHGDFV